MPPESAMPQSEAPAVPGRPDDRPPVEFDFPLERSCPFDPPARYAGLRAEQPAVRVRVPDGATPWLVTRYEDVRRILLDPALSADRRHPALPMTEMVTPQGRQAIGAVSASLIGLDPPDHGRRRGLLLTEFTVRRINSLRPAIQRHVDELIDALLAGDRPVDLVEEFCLPVPSRVLCDLLGVPYADREFFQSQAAVQVRRGVPPQERQRAGYELRMYLDQLITAKEADPGDDLLGRLIVRDRETREFDHGLLVGLATLLMIAGHESTANMIALGVAGVLSDPAQRAVFTGGDQPAVAMAVEEMLRYYAIVDTMPRVAKGDIEVGGVRIEAGEGVLIGFASANRDEAVFPGADRIDLSRGARHHVAFGYGIHQCIGQNLARAELDIVFGTLFRRIPELRLAADLEDLPFKTDSSVYGLDHLPVTW